MRGAVCQRCCEYCPLGEALGRRHSQALFYEKLLVGVNLGRKLVRGRMAGGRGLFRREGRIGERCAAAKAVGTGRFACFSHSEGHQPSLQGIDVFQHDAVKGAQPRCIFCAVAGSYDFGYVCTVAEAAGKGHLQSLVVGSLLVVMVGADDFSATFAAELLETPAECRRGLYLQVGEARAGLNGKGQLALGVAPAGRVRSGSAAGRHKGNVRLPEQLLNLTVGQRTKVEAYFRHLQVRQQDQNLIVSLILDTGTNHSGDEDT